MTDVEVAATEWVPRVGLMEVLPERAALIRGLFELAASVADHPELPVPSVEGHIYTGDPDDDWELRAAVVDELADALGVETCWRAGGGHYVAQGGFGPVEFYAVALTAAHMSAHQAHMSYRGNVSAEPTAGAGVR